MLHFDQDPLESFPQKEVCESSECAQMRLKFAELENQVTNLRLEVSKRDEALDDYRDRVVNRSVRDSIDRLQPGTKVLLFLTTLPLVGSRFKQRLIASCADAKIINP